MTKVRNAVGAMAGVGSRREARARGTRLRRPTPERERREVERAALVAPLFAYCAERCIAPLWLARRAALRAGGGAGITKMQLWRIRRGQAVIPAWFIEGMCRELGQPVEVVLGEEWRRQMAPAPDPTIPTTPAVEPASQPGQPDQRRAS